MVRVHKLFVVTGLALILAIGGATAGIAAITGESETEAVPPNEVGTAVATCPRGSETVSHGFRSDNFDPDWLINPAGLEAVYPIASRRSGSRKAKASGLNLGGDPGDLTAYAYCADPTPGLSVVKSDPLPVAAQTVETAKAKCPRGSEAVGGGAVSKGFGTGPFGSSPRVYTVGSRRAGDRAWKVTGAEINNADGGSIVALAYCDRSEPGLAKRSARVEIPASYGARGTAKAKCARGDIAQAGGFQVVGFDPTYSERASIYPLASKRAGRRGWKATGHNDWNTAPGDLIAYAYCLG